MQMAALFSQKNIQLLGHLTYPNNVEMSNLTGYADTAGNEYALVGTSQGLSIVNITDPTNPTQLFMVPGATGQGGAWREVREYKGYAYVTTEQNSGLQIVNLHYLPDSVAYHTVNPGSMHTSHTIFIDEHGIAYVNGTDKDQLFLDLNANPWNPTLLGKYSNAYVHDCFVRNDTMWAACINDGVTKTIDVTNKANANVPANTLASWATPLDFSHNCWLSDDSKYLFTTDEKPNSYLTCYDVTNLNNITETDRTQVDPGSNTIIHNTYFMNNYCITSYYTYGIAIHDVTRKNNLVEVGNYDTSPAYSGDGFNGAWGVWPYLPSGNIIVSDIETGLWILKPTYTRAFYLEGLVKYSLCNTVFNNVKIEILSNNVTDYTNFLGKYSTGTPDSGIYTIRFSKAGYQTRDYTNIHLVNGVLTTINAVLTPSSTAKLTIKTVDAATGDSLPFIRILLKDNAGNTYQEVATDNTGRYAFCDFVQGSYDVYAGRWGKVTAHVTANINTNEDSITIPVGDGYYDDFIMDYGWTISSTATSGDWERANPIGTDYNGAACNPEDDVTTDFGTDCFTTGNNGGAAGDDDVDGGYTLLRSPLFDVHTYNEPYLSYYRWFFNDGGAGTAPNDSLLVYLSNGIDTVLIDTVSANSGPQSQWLFKNKRVKDFITPTANMRILFKTADYDPGHLVEAGVDLFSVVDSMPNLVNSIPNIANVGVRAYPNPFTNQLNIAIDNLNTTAQLQMVNTFGQTVYTSHLNSGNQLIQVNKNLASGIYYLRITNNTGTLTTLKVVKTE
jgi:choice-of-anchor B domain-containing protein